MKNTRKNLTLLLAAGSILLLLSAAAVGDRYFEMAKSMDVFASIYKDLNSYYVDSLSPQGLMESAVTGMTSSLDPYTYFYPQDNLDELSFQTTGKYVGIGVSILKLGDWTVISDVYPGSPMRNLGIHPGDRIDSLAGKSAKGMELSQISSFLRGNPGTLLHISVMNPYSHLVRNLVVQRAEIDLNPVAYAGMVSPKVGYIRFVQFTEYSADRLKEAYEQLKGSHPSMTGLILDLRDNPGGLLEEAVKVASMYLPLGDTIVTTRGRVPEWNKTYVTSISPIDTAVRLAVLTDNYTASASEIVAGALQDKDRAVILGQRSFGKGLVQTTRNLPYNSKLKLTVARYYTPSGRCIQAIHYIHSPDGQQQSRIPDSLQHSFYTLHRRIVKDGGGIEPDINIKAGTLSPVCSTLVQKNMIFEYATLYCHKYPNLPDTVIHIDRQSLESFYRFVDEHKYKYVSKAAADLQNLKNDLGNHTQSSSSMAALNAIGNTIKRNQEETLRANGNQIAQLLEEEIMSHYFSEKGRIEASIRKDSVVLEAEKVLTEKSRYDSILHL